jgi:hypothetical protein
MESGAQAQTLNQILSEVRLIGAFAQDMKWEMPGLHLTYGQTAMPTPPVFPGQSEYATPSPAAVRGQGLVNFHAKPPDQR